ncbi:MAG: response regulator transcription factor [Saprospiraceae bacterium]|nr:response regulator transcription factor [Saprospiraceae bacterium]
MIKVAIYEDNDGLREALGTAIEAAKDISLVGSYGHCVTVLDNTQKDKPDVVIMDIDMPGKSGIEGVRDLKKHFPATEIIMNTVFDDDDRIYQAITAGATGYMLKRNGLQELIAGIHEVMKGGAPMSPTIARKVMKAAANGDKGTSQNLGLSPRELEIIQLLAKGNSYKMVAQDLNLSIDTIRSHIKKTYEKLHVHSVTEAIHKVLIEKRH